MTDIFLFRHGHVDYTPPQEITARSPLSPLGHQMAERLAARCDAWQLQMLFVSSMRRAQETANAISARYPKLPRLDVAEFEETSIRDMEGYPGEMPSENLLAWQPQHFAYANQRMAQRVVAGWERMLQLVEDRGLERIAIVAHGGSFNAILRHFQYCDVAGIARNWFELDWTATCCLRTTPQGRWVRWTNDARHIDDLRYLL
jgi:broad specificity phosphatase PhoE